MSAVDVRVLAACPACGCEVVHAIAACDYAKRPRVRMFEARDDGNLVLRADGVMVAAEHGNGSRVRPGQRFVLHATVCPADDAWAEVRAGAAGSCDCLTRWDPDE